MSGPNYGGDVQVVDFRAMADAKAARPVLIDGNNLVVRSIMASALDDLKAGGVWTGGIYGALNSLSAMLLQFERENTPAREIVMFFDGGVPPERKKLIPSYKQERKERRELLTAEEKEKAFTQLAACQEMFPLLGVKVLRYKDREADDCVAAAAVEFARQQKVEPIVVSGDRDLLQCVQFGARVWYLSSKEWVTRDNFAEATQRAFKLKEKFLGPDLYVLFRALTGDDSDGIDGVRGLGPARASQLLLDAAVWVDTASNGGFSLADYDPVTQLVEVCRYLEESHNLAKLPAFKQGILDDRKRLADVIAGISLRESFGPTTKLMARVSEPTTLSKMDALRWFNARKFKSVLSDPSRYIAPYERAIARANAARAMRRAHED